MISLFAQNLVKKCKKVESIAIIFIKIPLYLYQCTTAFLVVMCMPEIPPSIV